MKRFLGLLALVAIVPIIAGCWSSEGDDKQEEFVLDDMVEDFTPPTLVELDAKTTWIDRPVVDPMNLLREHLATEPALVNQSKALTMKNNSPQANKEILSALGRLPESDAQVDYDASITRYAAADVKSSNPLFMDSTVEFDVSGLTGFGLFGFDWQMKPFAVTDTVKSWQSSEDRMYDKVVMRDDLTWSDGKPITAHDVAFSFKVIMSSQVPVPAMRTGTDQLRWVEAYDDHTLVFFHKAPSALNDWNMNFAILPKHVYEESIKEDPSLQQSDYHVEIENNPVVGGPYQVTSRSRNLEIILTRRKEWYTFQGKKVRSVPYFKEVRFRIITDPSVALLALKGGDVDAMELTPEQWTTQTDGDDFYRFNTKVSAPQWGYYYFGWNLKDPRFSDKRVRKAMSYAFDHDELLNNLLHGANEAANGDFHPNSPWHPKDAAPPYKRDLAKAEQLLQEAGWIDHDGDGIRDKEINGQLIPFEFTLFTSNRPDRISFCELMKQNLDQVGIRCTVRPLEFTVLQDRLNKRQFQAYFAGWGSGAYPDTTENIWMTGKDRNFTSYSNPEVDRLFVQARKEFDHEKRREIFGKIHKIIYEDQPYTWLYYMNAFYGFNKNIRGYFFSPRGPYTYSPGFSSFWRPKMQ